MKKLAARQCLEQARLLWPDCQHGVFVGTDDDERVFVGFITRNRACFRFTGPTYEVALYSARAWTATNRSRYEACAVTEPKYVRRPAPVLTDEEQRELAELIDEECARMAPLASTAPAAEQAETERQP